MRSKHGDNWKLIVQYIWDY